MITDQAFREKVADELGAVERTVTITQEGDVKVVRVDMRQEVRDIPPAAAKLIGDAIQIIQEERWSGPRADVHITTPKLPAVIKGTAQLSEADGVTTQQVDLDIKASIPLIGGKLEELMAALVDGASRIEQRTGTAWLA